MVYINLNYGLIIFDFFGNILFSIVNKINLTKIQPKIIMELKRQIGLFTAVMVIIADMIGTGIFMTTGNVLGITGNSLVVLLLWVVGGIIAVTGLTVEEIELLLRG